MYLAMKKKMPGLTPAAWRKAAAHEMGLDYDTYLALWKANKGAAKAVKMNAASTPTVPAASSSAPTMGIAKKALPAKPKPVAMPIKKSASTKAPAKTQFDEAKEAVDQLKAAVKSGELDAEDVHDIMSDMVTEYGDDPAVKLMIDANKKAIMADMTQTAKQKLQASLKSSEAITDADDIFKQTTEMGLYSVDEAVEELQKIALKYDTAAIIKHTEDLIAKLKTQGTATIKTPYGPLTHDLAQSVYKKIKKDMPGGTPAQWRHLSADYLGVGYDDYLKAWKKPTSAAQKSATTSASKLPPIKTPPLSPSSAGKYANKDLSPDQLKSELAKLYGPGANKDFIALHYDDLDGSYTVEFPNSLLPTPASKGAVAAGLENLGLKVTWIKGGKYKIYSPKSKATASKNFQQIKSTGTYTLPDGRVVFDKAKSQEWSNSWWAQQPERVKKAWRSYTGSGYRRINSNLRKGGAPTATDQALSGSMQYIQHEVAVFRGTSISMDKFKVGGIWQDKGFLSTAIDPGSAWSGVKFEIICPKGTKGMYIGSNSAAGNELEFLLDRGTKFHVIEVNRAQQTVKLVAIPHK